jgi:hypothetical protein
VFFLFFHCLLTITPKGSYIKSVLGQGGYVESKKEVKGPMRRDLGPTTWPGSGSAR